MRITIQKFEDATGYYWLIKNENNEEIMSYCREVSQYGENRKGGYIYEELIKKIKEHKEWEL